jgi:nitrite reductase/ring-hydroxylating ferredoxin subunit
MTWLDVGPDDVAEGDLREAHAAGRVLGLARAGGRLHAFDVWCTHADCPLTDGWLEGEAVRCACHGALFRLFDGMPLEGPAEEPVQVFAARSVGGRIEVDLRGASDER